MLRFNVSDPVDVRLNKNDPWMPGTVTAIMDLPCGMRYCVTLDTPATAGDCGFNRPYKPSIDAENLADDRVDILCRYDAIAEDELIRTQGG